MAQCKPRTKKSDRLNSGLESIIKQSGMKMVVRIDRENDSIIRNIQSFEIASDMDGKCYLVIVINDHN